MRYASSCLFKWLPTSLPKTPISLDMLTGESGAAGCSSKPEPSSAFADGWIDVKKEKEKFQPRAYILKKKSKKEIVRLFFLSFLLPPRRTDKLKIRSRMAPLFIHCRQRANGESRRRKGEFLFYQLIPVGTSSFSINMFISFPICVIMIIMHLSLFGFLYLSERTGLNFPKF